MQFSRIMSFCTEWLFHLHHNLLSFIWTCLTSLTIRMIASQHSQEAWAFTKQYAVVFVNSSWTLMDWVFASPLFPLGRRSLFKSVFQELWQHTRCLLRWDFNQTNDKGTVIAGCTGLQGGQNCCHDSPCKPAGL